MGENVQAQGNRRRAGIALALAVLLTFGVIIGAKLFQDDQARNPVMLQLQEMPDDDSPRCAELLDRLPDRLDGLVRAELGDPAPKGAAVWRNTADERVTLRCGAPVPIQYTELSTTENHRGVNWFRIDDNVQGSNLATWYSIGRTPVVAVTADASRMDAIPNLSEAMLPDSEVGGAHEPNPVPLTDLAADEADERCSALLAALPTKIGERTRVDDADLPAGSMVWVDDRGSIVSLRCGVGEPEGYADTEEQLTQINDIVWFAEPSMSFGDVGTWYAMGRERFVAVHLPVAEASGVLPAFSDIIAANLENTSPSEE